MSNIGKEIRWVSILLPTDQSQSCIMNYTHLTQDERYLIFTLLREDFSIRYITWRLNRSPSTISREINSNKARKNYFAKHTNKLAKARHCPDPKRIPADISPLVIHYLNLQWSPEKIASHVTVSPISIYRFIQHDKCNGGLL